MVASLLLLVLVLATCVLVIMVSLCTRRCRKNLKKKTNTTPSVPNEDNIYYETAEVGDCVQMQTSPVYATIEEAKCHA